jgi:alpha-glucosidase
VSLCLCGSKDNRVLFIKNTHDMKCKFLQLILVLIIAVSTLHAQKSKSFTLSSPDGNIQLKIEAGDKLQWSVVHQSTTVIAPSSISLQLQGGETLGDNAKITSSKTEKINSKIAAMHYKKDTITDNYNQLTMNCKGDYGTIFRAYNDGVAYRFFTKKKDSIIVQSEEANFNFADDDSAFIPYANNPHNGDKYECSF